MANEYHNDCVPQSLKELVFSLGFLSGVIGVAYGFAALLAFTADDHALTREEKSIRLFDILVTLGLGTALVGIITKWKGDKEARNLFFTALACIAATLFLWGIVMPALPGQAP